MIVLCWIQTLQNFALYVWHKAAGDAQRPLEQLTSIVCILKLMHL